MDFNAPRIRTRHFFGFLIPGSLWLAALCYWVFDTSALRFIEGVIPPDNSPKPGTSIVTRALFFLSAAYLVGFYLQTMIWPFLMNPLKAPLETAPEFHALRSRADAALGRLGAAAPKGSQASSSAATEDHMTHEQFARFCKLVVLARSEPFRDVLLEKEDDLNFLAAGLFPGMFFVLTFTWMTTKNTWMLLWVGVACLLLFVALRFQLRRYVNHEYADWLIMVSIVVPNEASIPSSGAPSVYSQAGESSGWLARVVSALLWRR